ncbi:hypothetical protein G6O67_003136 [Ophiocordyceps sinensis]|uniref:Uncharacterized protein n=1 Tax=Ophiocordyceps sinensis TaxID=72228 RepID=A0A8H4PVP0_9HYPO|nr:hypothetical protein G6O67_003136 [Ophiocordyceps sinensis]
MLSLLPAEPPQAQGSGPPSRLPSARPDHPQKPPLAFPFHSPPRPRCACVASNLLFPLPPPSLLTAINSSQSRLFAARSRPRNCPKIVRHAPPAFCEFGSAKRGETREVIIRPVSPIAR